jgi:predicted trehalose synthase
MSAPATWVDGAGFYKRHTTAFAVQTALRHSNAARIAGIPTPAARPSDDPEVLVFDRIEAEGTPTLSQLVAALAPLRRMPSGGLPRFNPFARILPRLADTPPAIFSRVTELQAADQALNWPAASIVHGDFHPGQVLRDRQGKIWLIDLDDLARGPTEADLGNLAARMATQTAGRLDVLSHRATEAVLAQAPAANAALMAHFRDIALLRRALKLRERGVEWVIGQLASGP